MSAGDIMLGFIVLLFLAGLATYVAIAFNGLVALRNEIRRAWANTDVLLKQRHDEVPNLVATVQGYAAHERAVLQAVTDARSRAIAARDMDARVDAEQDLTRAITGLFAVAEAYPDLKASDAFVRLQVRITQLEDAIADRRELYNDAVTALRDRQQTFPDGLVARLTGQTAPEPLFQAPEADRAPLSVHP